MDYAAEYGEQVVKYERDREAFVHALDTDRADTTGPLAFADYWDEQGLPGVAEVIRRRVAEHKPKGDWEGAWVGQYFDPSHDVPPGYESVDPRERHGAAQEPHAVPQRREKVLFRQHPVGEPAVMVSNSWMPSTDSDREHVPHVGIHVLFKTPNGRSLAYGVAAKVTDARRILDGMGNIEHAELYRNRLARGAT